MQHKSWNRKSGFLSVAASSSHPIHRLYRDFHHAIAAQVALSATDLHNTDWSEIKAANQVLQWVILTEHHRQMGES